MGLNDKILLLCSKEQNSSESFKISDQVGYNWSDEKELIESRVREVYESGEIRFMSRSALAKKCQPKSYEKYIRKLQRKWANKLKRPIAHIKSGVTFFKFCSCPV